MSDWVKIFNSLPAHLKILRAGDRAAWLYVCGLCYSNEHLTDGFIAREVLVVAAPGVKSPARLAAKLVEVGLWHAVEGGWAIHDYAEVQRTSTQVKELRRKDAERKSRKDSATTTRPESARRPDGIHAESDGTPDVEKSREEKKTPIAPQGAEDESAKAKVLTFGRAKVSDERRILAEAVLADFNRQAGTGYSAYRGDGKASEDLKRILGALQDAEPPVTLTEAATITRWRLAHPFWQGRPHTGVVFGPNVFPANRESARGMGVQINGAIVDVDDQLARADRARAERRAREEASA